MISVAFVRAALMAARVDLSSEKAAQADLAEVLSSRLPGVSVEREVRLSGSDIPDILVDGGIVVEVKLRASGKRAIFRQLERYAAHDGVVAIILASNTAMGLPAEIGGKPAFIHSLGRGWV